MYRVLQYIQDPIHIDTRQGRRQDFVIGGAKRKFGGGGTSLKNFKILNIGLINFYVMFK